MNDPKEPTETISESLRASRDQLAQAGRHTDGAQTDAALHELIRVVRAQGRVLERFARLTHLGDEPLR